MKKCLASILYKAGIPYLLDAFWGPERLTVLVYHRINEINTLNFAYDRDSLSASPEMFERQMAYIAKHFNVINLLTLQASIYQDQSLPPRPSLITFDDGYLDNYTYAYPILRAHNFPAVIFLTTGYIDDLGPAWWDECAYYFHLTRKTRATLPLLGEQDLSTSIQRAAVHRSLLNRLKQVSEAHKKEAMHKLRAALDVAAPPRAPSLFLSWEQVRELVANGIACQSHTVTHPILTRVGRDETRRQLVQSRARIEAETDQAVVAFAYPNGMPTDYDDNTLQILRETGYTMAFTLAQGPMRAWDVRQHPLEIARVHLRHQDTFEIFVMKVMGLLRLV